jgi:HD-GYP domain-containing protein (c-di-GMP phosphodiesterase class II)
MVRLIHMLKKGLKKALASGQPPPADEAPVSAPAGAESLYVRRKGVAVPGEEAREYLERFNGLKDLYHELMAVVTFTLTGAVHRQKITEAVTKVVDVFMARPYNELLLMTYTSSRKNYLAAHIVNDVILTVAFALDLGHERHDAVDLGICALTHDLGMSSFEILAKKDRQLNAHEIEDIKRHPILAAGLVRPVFGEKIASVVGDIHERENGQGYPRGIPGAEVHAWAKIISICDTFEALTHPRVFRAAYSPYEAMKIIINKKNIFFDDTVVRRFIDFMSIYPVGMVVGLNTGETAIVTASNRGFPTRPLVRVLISAGHEVEELYRTIDLARQNFIYITGAVDPEKEREILDFLKPRGQADVEENEI